MANIIDRKMEFDESAYTDELLNLLKYMEDKLSVEVPTTVLSIYYFVVAVFEEKNNMLWHFLEDSMTESSLETIYGAYFKEIQKHALTAVKPERKLIYSDDLVNALNGAKDMASTYFVEEGGKISSCHVYLHLLLNDDEDNRVRKIFNHFGCNFAIAVDKLSKFMTNYEVPKNEIKKVDEYDRERPVKAIAISGFDKIKDFGSPESFMRSISKLQDFGGSKLSNVKNYCTNLNELVEKGAITKLIGREKETNELIRVLGRKNKNNAILIGAEGVGKTAIAENLAYKIVNGDVPLFLRNKTIVSLDMTSVIAGTSLRGMFEERIFGILSEIKEDGNIILVIDDISDVIEDKSNNDKDISGILVKAMERGECQVIGTCDYSSYRKSFGKKANIARRFHKIVVETPSESECVEIIRGVSEIYEKFHCVKYSDDVLTKCVSLAKQYMPERNLPDSAIDLLDEVGAFRGRVVDSENVTNAYKEVVELEDRIKKLKEEDNYTEADTEEKILITKRRDYNTIIEDEKAFRANNPVSIEIQDLLDIVSLKTGVPVSDLNANDKEKLIHIDEKLKKFVIGQDEAIDTICKALRRNRVGLHKSGCMYSFMAIGKTGTGKTLLAKRIAKEIYGSENALVRFDMSEYPDKTAVNKLIGSNPGYVGYEDGGLLTEAIKNKKYCVLLLDEIEKADHDVYNIFLQLLDEGFLTDNSGQRVDFSNVLVIFTSNVGTKAANDFGRSIGFDENSDENTKKILSKELKNTFPPEFINRVDNIIYFNNLTDDNLRTIIRLELDKLQKRVSEIGHSIEYNDTVIDFLFDIVKKDKDYGARPIVRAIQDNIEDKITDYILQHDNCFKHMSVYAEDNNILISE